MEKQIKFSSSSYKLGTFTVLKIRFEEPVNMVNGNSLSVTYEKTDGVWKVTGIVVAEGTIDDC